MLLHRSSEKAVHLCRPNLKRNRQKQVLNDQDDTANQLTQLWLLIWIRNMLHKKEIRLNMFNKNIQMKII